MAILTTEQINEAWNRAARGEATGSIATSLGTDAQSLRVAMGRAGRPISGAREVWHNTIIERMAPYLRAGDDWPVAAEKAGFTKSEAREALAAADLFDPEPEPTEKKPARKPRSKYQRMPIEAIEAGIQEVVDGGPDVSVTRIANAYGVKGVSLNAAVRAEMKRRGILLSSAVVRRAHLRESVEAVERMMHDENVSMAEACRKLDLSYLAIAKAFSRRHQTERLQKIKDQVVNEIASQIASKQREWSGLPITVEANAALIEAGRLYREEAARLPKAPEAHVKFLDKVLGTVYTSACTALDFDALAHAKGFGDLLSTLHKAHAQAPD